MADGGNVSVGPKPDKDTTPSGSGNTGGGGGANDPVQAAIDREKQYRADAANRYMKQAQILQIQAHKWKQILSKKGFRKALMTKLDNVSLDEKQSDDILMQGYDDRVGSLKNANDDNKKDASAKTNANLMNASRERANALSEASLQGAGETDMLRSQGMALRNWSANQNEVGRAFADTQTALNSSLNDLNVDTRQGRFNVALQANADREMLWSNYYDRRSEALTQLGNTMGQISEYYAMSNEQKKSKEAQNKEDKWRKNSKDVFGQLAKNTQKAWDDPGVSKNIRQWDGRGDFEGGLDNRQFGPQDLSMKRPSGADLRKWE
jgi:hypothetical protein